MGSKKQSELRRAENEVVFKQHNEKILEQVNQVIPEGNRELFMVSFVCECSDETCHQRIELTVEQFHRYSTNPKRFIIIPGHEQSDIEQIIEHFPFFDIVEKFELPPATDGVLNNTQVP